MAEPLGLLPQCPVAQWRLGDHYNFVYLILDWESREAAWVDSWPHPDPVLDALAAHGFRLTTILLTHTHWDHIGGLDGLLAGFPDAELRVHPLEKHRLTGLALERARDLRDGEVLRVGALRVNVLHTPGHTAGAVCYYLETGEGPCLLTGDTVFVRGCGRTDLPTGSDERMFESLQKLKRLPGRTRIFPGHQYSPEAFTTLESEMRESPPFRCASVAELAGLP